MTLKPVRVWGGVGSDGYCAYYITLDDDTMIVVTMDRDNVHGTAYNYDKDMGAHNEQVL